MNAAINNTEAPKVGENISDELSSFLRKHITQVNCHEICAGKGLSGYTLYAVVRRDRKVSSRSIDALNQLIALAKENYQEIVQNGKKLQRASK